MKRILPLAALALLGACGPSAEREPNDHFTQATPLKPGGSAKGTIGSPGDADWYRLEGAREGGVMSFKLQGIRSVDFVVSLLDKERQELKRFDETGIGGDEEGWDLGVGPAPYFLTVANKDPKAAPDQPYKLVTRVDNGTGREREPNDRAVAANPLEPGGVVRGHYFPSRNLLAAEEPPAEVQASTEAAPPAPTPPAAPSPQSEEDWFRLKVAKSGLFSLNIDLSEVPKVDPVLEIYDSNFYRLKELDLGGLGEAEGIKNFGIRGPVEYLLRLRTKTRQTNTEVPYELLTELLPYAGTTEFEPNDQRLDATPFGAETITGTIAPAADMDWYRVAVSSEGRFLLRAELTALPKMDLTLTLADDLGNPLVLADNMGREQPESLTGFGVSGRDYYLVVAEKSRKALDGRRNYTLTRTLTPFQPGLEYEANDSTPTAQALKMGESVDGYFAPKADLDYYEFNVYQSGSVALEVSGVPAVRLGLALLEQEGKELERVSSKKAGEPLTLVRTLEQGTYTVRLSAEDPGQNNVRDKYTLRVRMR